MVLGQTQNDALLTLLEKIASSLEKIVIQQQQPYTITGASDWPMLLALFGILGLLLSIIIMMLASYHRTTRQDQHQYRIDCRNRLDNEFRAVHERINRHEEVDHA